MTIFWNVDTVKFDILVSKKKEKKEMKMKCCQIVQNWVKWVNRMTV